jgi:hypothetical protein
MKVRRYCFQQGNNRVIEIEFGHWMISIDRLLGTYGYEHTISYGVRWYKR